MCESDGTIDVIRHGLYFLRVSFVHAIHKLCADEGNLPTACYVGLVDGFVKLTRVRSHNTQTTIYGDRTR